MTQPQTAGPHDPNWITAQVRKLRLSWRLLRDPQVPLWVKLIPLGAITYILLPVDIIPDVLPIIGQLDDVGVFLLSLQWFVALCPSSIVRQHVAEMSSVKADYRVVPEDAPPPPEVAGYLDVESHPVSDEHVEDEKG